MLLSPPRHSDFFHPGTPEVHAAHAVGFIAIREETVPALQCQAAVALALRGHTKDPHLDGDDGVQLLVAHHAAIGAVAQLVVATVHKGHVGEDGVLTHDRAFHIQGLNAK